MFQQIFGDVRITSDKTFASKEGDVVRFTDGSWVNVATADFDNKPYGTITIEMVRGKESRVSKSLNFNSLPLMVQDFRGELRVVASTNKSISVVIEGLEREIKCFNIEETKSGLLIAGGPVLKGARMTIRSEKSRSSSVEQSISNGSARLPVVNVYLPVGESIDLADLDSDAVIEIGDIAGSIKLNIDDASVSIGLVKHLEITASDDCSISVTEIDGYCNAYLDDDSTLSIKRGNITNFKLQLDEDCEFTMGSGRITGAEIDLSDDCRFTFKGDLSNATIRATEDCQVNLGNVTGDLTLKAIDDTSINIAGGNLNTLTATADEDSKVVFSGFTIDADLKAVDDSLIRVSNVKNRPVIRERDDGKVIVGNWK
jgi:hypothetical protein